MDNFRFIDAILVLTGGGPADATKILPVYLFDVSFQYFKLGRGAAIALTLLVVTIILGMLLVRVFENPASKQRHGGLIHGLDGHRPIPLAVAPRGQRA